jgi:hypothetical protein
MYITDLQHFLDERGAIAPANGPARSMASFQAVVVAHASDPAGRPPAPTCFKCKAPVEASIARDGAVFWACPACRAEGRISNWQGTLWDLRHRQASSNI